ncbi:MATE family efflux transporter, partial [Blautia wexlerae]
MSKFMKSLCKIAIPVTLQSMLQASFSIVDQIMIGQLGETNISAVGLCGNFSLIFSVVIGAVAVSALLILLAGVYTGLYRVDDSVKDLGKTLLIVFALYAPVKVENMILGGGIIRSGGNTKIIMIIDIVGTWCIGIPLCLLAAYVFKWGIVGVYTLLTTEELFRLAVSLIVFNNRSKNSLTSIWTPLKKSLFCIKQYNIKC